MDLRHIHTSKEWHDREIMRWIPDFRALNKALKRRVCPIPCIQDILSCRSGCKFLSKLDISARCWTFALGDGSEELCAIATPFALCKFNRSPMFVSQLPGIAWEMMEQAHIDIQRIEAHNDDVAVFSTSLTLTFKL